MSAQRNGREADSKSVYGKEVKGQQTPDRNRSRYLRRTNALTHAVCVVANCEEMGEEGIEKKRGKQNKTEKKALKKSSIAS